MTEIQVLAWDRHKIELQQVVLIYGASKLIENTMNGVMFTGGLLRHTHGYLNIANVASR